MLKRLTVLGTFVMSAVCSVAYGLQPTVRAGSLSLNSAARPVTNTITSTSSQQSGISTNPARGSTISKFSSSVVPVSGQTKENYNYDSSVLDEIRQQIRDLQDAQLALENNQLGQSDIEDTIINQFQTVNLTTTNRDLKNALTEIRSTNQDLQSSLDSIQQQAELLTESLNTDIDNRLKVRGLIDSNNNVSFANKSDLEPAALAQSLTSNTHAKTILTSELQPSTNSIKEIIADDLKDREILATDGTLNVEKKGSVQINESTVTNALRNSTAFKNMVSDEVATKGYVTENALADKDYVTTSALNTRNYLTSDSAAIRDLATKSDIAPDTLANKLVGNTTAKTTLENAIGGTDTTTVNNLINTKLTQTGITDAQGNRQFATLNDLPVINEQTVAAALGNSDVISDAVDTALSNKNYLTSNSSTIQNLGNQISNLNTQIAQKANASDITPTNIANNLVGDSTARATLAAQIGTNETRVNELIDNQLKDSNGQIKYALKTDLPVINEETVSAALGNSNVISEAIDTALSNNTTFALKSEIAPETLGDALKETNALKDKFALKSEVGTNETRVNELIDDRDFATKTALTNAVGTVTTSLNTLDSYVNGNVDTNGSLLHKIKNDETIRAALTGPQGPQGPAGQDADAVQVASILNADPIFKESVKGEPGSGFNYRGEVNQYSELPSGAQVAQGDAYYNYSDTLLYIYSCDTNNVCKFPTDGNGVPFKGQPGETGQSAWYAYCISDNNLTNIIKPLYGNDVNCTTFTAAQYNAIMGGPRAYCLSLVEKRSDLVTTTGIGAKLNTIFAEDIVTQLKNASNPFTTTVTLNGGQIRFLDACEQKYLEIMAGANGANGEPGTNGKSAAEIWCEADAENYSGQTNLYVIQKLFPNDNVNSCADFTDAQYAKIMGGAIAYCTSLSATFDRVDLNNGIGLNLARVLVNTNRAANLQEAKTKLQTLQSLSASGRLENTGARIFVDTNNNPITLLQSCIENFNNIMSGNDGADGANGQSAKDIYCNAQAENYPNGTTNLTIIQKLFPSANITDCTEFTDAQYAAIMGGAMSYCTSFTATFNTVELDRGPGLRLAQVLVDTGRFANVSAAQTQLQNLKQGSATARLSTTIGTNNPITLLQACIENFNNIMAGNDGAPGARGADAETVWHAYCEAESDIYPDQTNLDAIIKPLYGNDVTCDTFTARQYHAILGGARAYCLSLATSLSQNTLDLTTGVGARLSANLGASAVAAAQSKPLDVILNDNSVAYNGQAFIPACEAKYNEIMAGEDGQNGAPGANGADGETAWHAYCNDNNQANLTNIIKPLYGNDVDCDTFTAAQYNAIMGGASAYCLSLATDLSRGTLNLTTGIGARLSANLGDTQIASVSGTNDLAQVLNATYATNKPFIRSCEEKYNEIMSGHDGQNGTNGAPGADGKSAAYIWCESHINDAEVPRALTPSQMMSTAYAMQSPAINNNGLFASMEACLEAVAANPNLMGGESAADQDFNNKNAGKTFADLRSANEYIAHHNGFIASLKGVPGTNGTNGTNGVNGQSAADIWCETRFSGAETTTQMTPSQIMMATLTSPQSSIINPNTGLFINQNACLTAVAANPDLMGGASAADQDFNNQYNNTPVNELSTSAYTAHHNGFVASLNGADGITWRPIVNNGVISWQQDNSTTTPVSLNIDSTAVNAVKDSLDSSTSTLKSSVESIANTQVNSLSNTLLTAQDLINMINSGVFVIDSNNKVAITTDTLPSGTSSNYGSLQKLNYATAGTVTVQCPGSGAGQCPAPNTQLISESRP